MVAMALTAPVSAGVGRACCNSVSVAAVVFPGFRSQRRSFGGPGEESHVVSWTDAWASVRLNWARRKQSSIIAAKVGRRAVAVGVSAGTAALIAGAVAAAGALAVAATRGGELPSQQAILVTRKGMQLFEQGKVRESLEKFDQALGLDPRQRPYLWQRGLSLYYLDRFEDGAAQFREDVAVNPNDTEEVPGYHLLGTAWSLTEAENYLADVSDDPEIYALWTFLCEAKLYGPEEARRRFLKVGMDSRPVMRKVYEVYRDGRPVEEILQSVRTPGGADFFYASLYTGLYHEAHGNADAAREAMIAAVRSSYGSSRLAPCYTEACCVFAKLGQASADDWSFQLADRSPVVI